MASECRLGTSLVRVAKDCFAWNTQTDLIQLGPLLCPESAVNKCKMCENECVVLPRLTAPNVSQ